MFSSIANSLQRREIRKFLQVLDNETSEKLAERLLLLYASRAIHIFPTRAQRAHLYSVGMSDADIEPHSILIYHYQKGNEVVLIEMMEVAQRARDLVLWGALNMHYYTNLAMSDECYDALVRHMWQRLFDGVNEVRTVYQKKFPDDALLDSPGLPKHTFLENPKTMTPHFLVSDSPISRELDIRRKVGRELGFF